MSVVTYTNFGGEIVYENRASVQHDYMRDSLGSTYALLNSTQTMTDTFTYWPYGEIRTQTGSTGTLFTFCGTLGYFFDSVSSMCYVRARHLMSMLARWLTVDPLWPRQPAYVYCTNEPSLVSDPQGLQRFTLDQCIALDAICHGDCAAWVAVCFAALGLIVVLAVAACGAVCVTGGVVTFGLACILCLVVLVALLGGGIYFCIRFFLNCINTCNLGLQVCRKTGVWPRDRPAPRRGARCLRRTLNDWA